MSHRMWKMFVDHTHLTPPKKKLKWKYFNKKEKNKCICLSHVFGMSSICVSGLFNMSSNEYIKQHQHIWLLTKYRVAKFFYFYEKNWNFLPCFFIFIFKPRWIIFWMRLSIRLLLLLYIFSHSIIYLHPSFNNEFFLFYVYLQCSLPTAFLSLSLWFYESCSGSFADIYIHTYKESIIKSESEKKNWNEWNEASSAMHSMRVWWMIWKWRDEK